MRQSLHLLVTSISSSNLVRQVVLLVAVWVIRRDSDGLQVPIQRGVVTAVINGVQNHLGGERVSVESRPRCLGLVLRLFLLSPTRSNSYRLNLLSVCCFIGITFVI